jgi:hypothetical protein
MTGDGAVLTALRRSCREGSSSSEIGGSPYFAHGRKAPAARRIPLFWTRSSIDSLAATVHLRADQLTVKSKHHCPPSTARLKVKMFKILSD